MSTPYNWFDNSARSTFTFTFPVAPPGTFCFDNKSLLAAKHWPFKRRRPLWDVDGSASTGKKKRRLRLHLITSRLSRPFSAPASNIVDRGLSRVAVWARGRRPDKNELRKAAIMNRVRQRLDRMKASQATRTAAPAAQPPAKPTHSQLVSQFALRDIALAKPRCYEAPLPPSPLGMANYDVLDMEDDAFADRNRYGDDEEDIDAEMSGCGAAFYSDFSVIDSSRGSVDGEDYDYLDELDGIPHEVLDLEDRPLAPDEKMIEMMKEKERHMETGFAHSTHSMASFGMV